MLAKDSTVWLAAHFVGKLTKKLVLTENLNNSIEILFKDQESSLRQFAYLLRGILRIFICKLDYCLQDAQYFLASFNTKEKAEKHRRLREISSTAKPNKVKTFTQEQLSEVGSVELLRNRVSHDEITIPDVRRNSLSLHSSEDNASLGVRDDFLGDIASAQEENHIEIEVFRTPVARTPELYSLQAQDSMQKRPRRRNGKKLWECDGALEIEHNEDASDLIREVPLFAPVNVCFDAKTLFSVPVVKTVPAELTHLFSIVRVQPLKKNSETRLEFNQDDFEAAMTIEDSSTAEFAPEEMVPEQDFFQGKTQRQLRFSELFAGCGRVEAAQGLYQLLISTSKGTVTLSQSLGFQEIIINKV